MDTEEQVVQETEKETFGDNARVQKIQWIKKQMERQRESEDQFLEKILEEQKTIQSLSASIDEGMDQTLERRRYNKEFQEDLERQIYELNGVSLDTLHGIAESKNSFYTGFTFCGFLLSVALIIVTGVLHGFQSQVSLYMLAATGVEAALLTQDKRGKCMNGICSFLHLFVFPMMFTIFLCYELRYPEYDLLLPYFSIAVIVLLVLSTMSGFLYNPYGKEKRRVASARDQIHEIEKIANKEVKKNKKRMKKLERQNRRKEKSLKWKTGLLGLFHRKKQQAPEIEVNGEVPVENQITSQPESGIESHEPVLITEDGAENKESILPIEENKIENETESTIERL